MVATVSQTAPALPFEILLEILDHLQSLTALCIEDQRETLNFGLVNRDWHLVSLAGSNAFVVDGLDQTLSFLNSLRKSSRRVKLLVLSLHSPGVGRPSYKSRAKLSIPKALKATLALCSDLTHLELATGWWIAVKVLRQSRHVLKGLKSLDLGTYPDGGGVNDRKNRTVSMIDFMEALECLPSLEYLCIRTNGVQWICQDASKWQRVPTFSKLSTLVFFSYWRGADDDLFYSFMQSQNCLTTLDIGGRLIDDEILSTLSVVAPRLKRFASSFSDYEWSWSHPRNIVTLVRWMTNIEELALEWDDTASKKACTVFSQVLYIAGQYKSLSLLAFGMVEVKELTRLVVNGSVGRCKSMPVVEIDVVVRVQDDDQDAFDELERLNYWAETVGLVVCAELV